jgi:hypothetical protein
MIDFPIRDRNDPTRIAEYQETRRKLQEDESGRALLDAHDRLIAAIDDLAERRRKERNREKKG